MNVLVLASGGIDSTTCIALAIDRYGKEHVTALCVYYGQKHDREIQAARDVAAYYEIELIELDLAKIFSYDTTSSLLVGSENEIPKESYADQLKKTDGKPVSTYVPFRNGLFLSSAASIALSKQCNQIFYGAHHDDAAGDAYPDCSEAFNNAMNKAIYLGSGKQLRIEAPFINMNKADIVRLGKRLNAPYHLTWSCYEGSDKPCGVCGTCRDRTAAFEANGMKDPALEEA